MLGMRKNKLQGCQRMIITIDCETQGLHARPQAYILGTICHENMTTETYNKPQDMKQRILELGEKQHKQGKTLNVYAHNLLYEWNTLQLWNTPNVRYMALGKKNIATIEDPNTKKDYIYFMDTMDLIRTNDNKKLDTLAKTINMQKGNTPQKLMTTQKQTYDFEEINQIRQYCELDTKIVMTYVKTLKQQLENDGIKIRKLMTIGQIAINYLTNQIRNTNQKKDWLQEDYNQPFLYQKRGWYWQPKNGEQIHKAYKGGRVQAFDKGTIHNVNQIDINSLYPHCLTQIKIPKIKTENKILQPLKHFNKKEITNKIGISKVLLEKPKEKIGTTPIKTGEYEIEYPKNKSQIIGTYTHNELQNLTKNGVKIKDIEYTITWEQHENNIFKDIIQDLYEKRQRNDGISKTLYKSIMNSMIGKLAERRTNTDIQIKTVEDYHEMTKQGYQIMQTIGTTYIYKKEHGPQTVKHYVPIIPAQVNAMGRNIMLQALQTLGHKNIKYCDTDGIIYKKTNNDKKLDFGTKMGQWKKEQENTTTQIYGKKTYSIGNQIKQSGTPKQFINKENFTKGKMKQMKMKTMLTATNPEEIGEFYEIERDLNEEKTEFEEKQMYINYGEDITYFVKKA